MKFKKFLIESSQSNRRRTISIDQAIDTITKKCKNVNVDKPLIRAVGQQMKDSAYILKGNEGNRESVTAKLNGDYYNVIIDHIMKNKWKDAPLRLSSTICGNYANSKHVHTLSSNIYYVFPLDDTPCAWINYYDMWYADLWLKKSISLLSFNKRLKGLDIKYDSYETILKGIINNINDRTISQFFDGITEYDELDKFITKGFLDILHYGHFKDIPIDKPCEVWIGDEVVAISANEYESVIKDKLKK